MNYNFCLFFNFFGPKACVFENFRWGIILLDFVGFPFKTSKIKNGINYIKYKFSHRFGKVFRWLNIYYSKIKITIFKKVITMSIWIILKNLVWTYKECSFCSYLAIVLCIHPILFVFHLKFLQHIERCIINVGKTKQTWK